MDSFNTFENYEFELETEYQKKIRPFIRQKIFEVLPKEIKNKEEYEDLLIDEWIKEKPKDFEIYYKIKYFQNKIGTFWQEVIPLISYSIIDLKTGHPSGLDWIRNNYKPFIAEVKNRYNTDNASAKKQNFNKLCAFMKNNPRYIGIYAIINEKKNSTGLHKYITHSYENNEYQILYLSGDCLFDFLFGKKKSYEMVQVVKEEIKIFFEN